jgi:NTE family protein
MILFMKKSNLIFLIIVFFFNGIISGQEYGLVLSGGGGKGAYEIGVWKALTEYGIAQKVTEISGTSVGGLNAALFASLSAADAENIWKKVVPRLLTSTTGTYRETLISQAGLKELIDIVPLQKIQNSHWPRITVTVVQKKFKILKMIFSPKPGSNAIRFVLNNERNTSELQKKLLATAAFPIICNPVTLKDGNAYTDGGEEKAGGDNIPITPVIRNPNVHTVFIVYLNDLQHITRRIRQIDYPSIKLIEIIPSIDLGTVFEGTVNFTSERIRLLIDKGYEDTVNILREKGYNPITPYWFDTTIHHPVLQNTEVPAAATPDPGSTTGTTTQQPDAHE